MIQMEARIVLCVIMSHPLSIVVNVRGFRMPCLIGQTAVLRGRTGILSGRCRPMWRNVSVPDVSSSAATAAMFRPALAESGYTNNQENS